jgi:hypothetical protein
VKKSLSGLNYILILLLLLFVLTSTSACQKSDYKIMSIKEGIQSFSFEYPQSYSLIRLNMENTPLVKYTEVGLSTNNGSNYSEIYVYIWLPGPDESTAGQIMDQLLGKASSTIADFSLVDKTTVMIGDSVAYKSTFTADSASFNTDITAGTTSSTTNNTNNSQSPPRPATYRVTSMMYSTLAVEIDMTCDNSITGATEPDYQHLLDTFAIGN